jgi:LysR family transcriptional regulator, low CO2-responsive transcriptional regulator
MTDSVSSGPASLREVHWNLHRLRLFRAVARHLSFTRAASDLAIAQPAVSHQVMALERDLGVRLLDRHGRGVQLTEAGLMVLETADEVLGRLDDLSRTLAELEVGERGSVDIAADTTSGIYVVPGVLGAFHRSHPAIDIRLHVENRLGVLRRLMERSCDLAIMASPPQEVRCDVLPFLADQLVVVAAPGHRLAGRSNVDPATLAEERFLAREPGSGTRAATERFFARHGLELRIAMELGSTGAIKQAVAAELGIAVVSRWAIDMESRLGRLAVLDAIGFPIERRWSIVNLQGRRLSSATLLTRRFLADHAATTASPLTVSGRTSGRASGAPA